MAKKSRTYIWKFVIGLGFLSGLWTSIGIDPQAVMLNILRNAVDTVYSDPAIRSLFLLLPTILIIISTASAYKKGRFLGLISVSVAYLAGLFILVSPISALVFLTIAIITGYLAPGHLLGKKLTFT
jgi:ABC-type multidrug transport system permease subunit